jgi:hypothetical protein
VAGQQQQDHHTDAQRRAPRSAVPPRALQVCWFLDAAAASTASRRRRDRVQRRLSVQLYDVHLAVASLALLAQLFVLSDSHVVVCTAVTFSSEGTTLRPLPLSSPAFLRNPLSPANPKADACQIHRPTRWKILEQAGTRQINK